MQILGEREKENDLISKKTRKCNKKEKQGNKEKKPYINHVNILFAHEFINAPFMMVKNDILCQHGFGPGGKERKNSVQQRLA